MAGSKYSKNVIAPEILQQKMHKKKGVFYIRDCNCPVMTEFAFIKYFYVMHDFLYNL